MNEGIQINKLIFPLQRFPTSANNSDLQADQTNPAICLYGRRFYKDQTPVEYLSEFLLVFASQKNEKKEGCYQFNLNHDNSIAPRYWPEDKVALKLFSFFPYSKLETRHQVHRTAYLDAINTVKEKINGAAEDKEEVVRLIQSLFAGFVGVAKNRTWVTYSFLPASTSLLAREVHWEHQRALKEKNKEICDWESSKDFFSDNMRSFMGRGGELLYLQIVNFFSHANSNDIQQLLTLNEYKHLVYQVNNLQLRLENGLRQFLEESFNQLGVLVNLIETTLDDYKINKTLKSSSFGWIPKNTYIEAALFTFEMDNIVLSNLGLLDKLDLLQTLCSFQVLRSLCFQARRVDDTEKTTPGFIGNYVWIVTDSTANMSEPIRQMSQNSFKLIDSMLYRVLRIPNLFPNNIKPKPEDFKNGDDNVFKHFRKFSKEIGLVIPPKGTGERFTLHQGLLRFLVAALVRPGERIRLNHFYQRVFAHYGIALGAEQLAVALKWCGNEEEADTYCVTANTTWIEEALQQGGFLVELSDAVSMVKNPG